MVNFRSFVEETNSGAFTSDQPGTPSYDGKLHQQVNLEFPTVTKHGEVIYIKVQGANYCIYVNGGITVLIPRKIYHKRYDRLPRAKSPNKPGDMVTAVFYKHKDGSKKDYTLKSFHIDSVR